MVANHGAQRAARTRLLVNILAIAVTTAIVIVASAVLFLRRSAAPPPPPSAETITRDASRLAAAPAASTGPAPRAVPKAPAARDDEPMKPTRRAVPRATPAAPTRAAASAPETVAQREARQVESLAQDVVEGMRARGEAEGLAAFPPPGTDPLKPGIVVPEDFELPEGYVRHYQITDDGRRLEPILMFSPDYDFVDDQGDPVALPENGIVPPEMAPPGLPVRVLDVPADQAPGTRTR